MGPCPDRYTFFLKYPTHFCFYHLMQHFWKWKVGKKENKKTKYKLAGLSFSLSFSVQPPADPCYRFCQMVFFFHLRYIFAYIKRNEENERKNIPPTNKYFFSPERMHGCTKLGYWLHPWHSPKHSNEGTCPLCCFYIWRYYDYGMLQHWRTKFGSNDIVSTWPPALHLNVPI